MCCFLVPLAQAVATTAVRKHIEKKSNSSHWSVALPKLELMLWGGTAMLIVDHIINGEVTYSWPFFTALTVEGGAAVMLREMLTVGLPMSILVTGLWALGVMLASRKTA